MPGIICDCGLCSELAAVTAERDRLREKQEVINRWRVALVGEPAE